MLQTLLRTQVLKLTWLLSILIGTCFVLGIDEHQDKTLLIFLILSILRWEGSKKRCVEQKPLASIFLFGKIRSEVPTGFLFHSDMVFLKQRLKGGFKIGSLVSIPLEGVERFTYIALGSLDPMVRSCQHPR